MRISQIDMAQEINISPSYLNLLENNQRPITVNLLFKLGQVYNIDFKEFSDDETGKLSAQLNEVFLDPVLKSSDITKRDIKNFVNSSPSIATAILTLFDSYIKIKEDVKGDLWVLSQGSVSNNEDPSISIIETQDLQIIKNFNLESNQSNTSSLNLFNNEVFFINKHVYKISSLEDTVQEIFLNNTGNTFYNLSIDPYNKDLYVTDAKDYVQNGSLLIIDSIGNLKNEVITGIIPKSIVF